MDRDLNNRDWCAVVSLIRPHPHSSATTVFCSESGLTISLLLGKSLQLVQHGLLPCSAHTCNRGVFKLWIWKEHGFWLLQSMACI